jgi:hypothetical protein
MMSKLRGKAAPPQAPQMRILQQRAIKLIRDNSVFCQRFFKIKIGER